MRRRRSTARSSCGGDDPGSERQPPRACFEPEHAEQQRARHHALPERGHADQKSRSAAGAAGRRRTPSQAGCASARDARAAEHHGGDRFERERPPDRHRDVPIGCHVEDAATPQSTPLIAKVAKRARTPTPASARAPRNCRRQEMRSRTACGAAHEDQAVGERMTISETATPKIARGEQVGQPDRQAGQPGAAERQEDRRAVDAEQAECADDRRYPAKHHDRRVRGRAPARSPGPRARPAERPARLAGFADGDGAEPHRMPTETSTPPIASSNVMPRPTSNSSLLFRRIVSRLSAEAKCGRCEREDDRRQQAPPREASLPAPAEALGSRDRRVLTSEVVFVDVVGGEHRRLAEQQNARLGIIAHRWLKPRTLLFGGRTCRRSAACRPRPSGSPSSAGSHRTLKPNAPLLR